MIPFDATSIPNHIYAKIVDTEDIEELLAMKNRYREKTHALVREAIDKRIENLRYHQTS